MNAMVEPQAFVLPKKPKVKEKEAPPDQRKLAVVPLKAVTDKNLTDGGLRVLAALCSYCNRAGITWVSQTTLATSLGVSRQSVTNQIAQLRRLGYIEIARKSFKGERPNTLRVIFDPTISAEDAIAITSAQEDTRPPAIKEEQHKHMTETVDKEGQRRIAELVAKALKQPTKKEPTMAQPGQSRYVKKMKEEIEQHKAKKAKAVDKTMDTEQSIGHPTVSNAEARIGHPTVSSLDTQECPRTPKEHIREVIYKDLFKGYLNVKGHAELRKAGLTDQQIDDNLAHLLDAYKTEGMTPAPDRLVGEIMQLAKVGL
jgi:hypothetical protein